MEDRKAKFIEKAKLIHGDRYDYSLVEYEKHNMKVTIVCPIHGPFEQTPTVHISNKCGCRGCGSDQRKRTCLLKYGGTSPAHSESVQMKRKRTCSERHGVEHAIQNPNIMKKKVQTTLERYGVENAMQSNIIQDKHRQTCLNVYGVDNVRKADIIKKKIKQTCLNTRGVEHHLQTTECMQKMRDTNKERYGVEYAGQVGEFKEKINTTNLEKYGTERPAQRHMLNIIHLLEDTEWLHDQYVTQSKTSTQIAIELNTTGFTVLNYLHKHSIDVKQQFNASGMCISWLEYIMKSEGVHIRHASNSTEFAYNSDNRKQKADGYCAETNTIYEFHGDYWHGNPQIYSPEIFNEISNTTMGELYQKTIERENKIKSLGYNLVVMWESDWNKLNKKINTISL